MPKSPQELREAAKAAVLRLANAYDVDVPDDRVKLAKDLRRKADEAVDALCDALDAASSGTASAPIEDAKPGRKMNGRTFVAKGVSPRDDGGYLLSGETEISVDTMKEGISVRTKTGPRRFLSWADAWISSSPINKDRK